MTPPNLRTASQAAATRPRWDDARQEPTGRICQDLTGSGKIWDGSGRMRRLIGYPPTNPNDNHQSRPASGGAAG
ncbi:hypothetical protein PAAG_12337 [Paracoccidioides lutzii Pb01]|uniref:Uncharacterized protein n=1 Tax=Paracoccidioides lutzii (strain ATCC MYA-826 / Pb01) TaxID=502779 RepID=A0A0A2V480_PARBA|nr:hypothetical protein PAAG_12337 [Paracoccidioides lutzii Pb01]KGQ00965.1 hypothetical protein PAAG_12337 [Paracoccidioides lutzii Pb01]